MNPYVRIESPVSIDSALIEQELSLGKEVTIQFNDNTYDGNILAQINELCARHDDKLLIRFYAHYGKSFDCAVVNSIPNVKALSIDCLVNAHNFHSLRNLHCLQKFGIGIGELKEPELLAFENLQKVTKLSLLDTKAKFNLEYLRQYSNIESLLVCGHTKNINSIGALYNLKSLRLASVSKVPLQFINELGALKSLSIEFGGRDNIHEIKENNIEHLKLLWITGLRDLRNWDNFRKLKTLQIEHLAKLPTIQFDSVAEELIDLRIFDCKTLSSVTGLGNLKALEHLRI